MQGRSPSHERLAAVVLVLSSLIVGLLLAEVGIRIFAPQPMNGIVIEYAPRGYSISKSSGTALFSLGNSKGIYHFMPPHLRGMRQPPADAVRILVLGDSFTFGAGLSEEDTYVERLQEKIDSVFGAARIALLNAGNPGSGTAEHLAFLEDFGKDIAPRLVLEFVSIDDFNRAQRSPLYRLHSTGSLELDEGTVPNSRLSRLKRLIVGSDAYNFTIQHVQIAQLIRRYIEQLIRGAVISAAFPSESKPRSATSADQQRLVRALFRRMKAWCDAHGAKLAVINNGWHDYDWLSKLLASESIPAFDATPKVQSVIARDVTSYVIQGDGHPNPKGAAVTAETVWPFIEMFIRENIGAH
jgi:lysophospholipase L1-like esterase